MESQAKPPKRHRRHWLIAAIVLVLVLASWWNWPRGDARFVGKWSVETTDAPPTLHGLTWNLHSNGVGTAEFISGQNLSQTFKFRWNAEGAHLRCGYAMPQWIHKTLNTIQQRLLRLTGSSFVHGPETYNVIIRSPEEIELQWADDPTDVTVLRRIPE